MMRFYVRLMVLVALGFIYQSAEAQFTRQDTLRGSVTPERAWWDLTHYHLDIEVSPSDSILRGSNTISYKVLEESQVLQVDLQAPLEITQVTQDGEKLLLRSAGNAHFVHLKKPQNKGDINKIEVSYEGQPHVAIRAPWDGGITWTKDNNGLDYVASSCQGIGASIWWPCKDHMYDEPDSMMISVTTPPHLMDVSNGQLIKTETRSDGKKTYHWKVTNPINNYGVNLSVGDYVHFDEMYEGEAGPLKLDYFVLRDNLEKAKEQFKQVPIMLDAFEHWFGPYPFYEDGFKLIEVPYLGMEHQSAVTYGNGYNNGYLGRDLSGSGWGMKFDYIIIHEAGHEWFANNITYKDIADMWVHESFTTYSEALYVEYHHGKEAGAEYIRGMRTAIVNDKPLIGSYGVNSRGSRDMYFKGSNILHTLRQVVADDDLWRQILRGLNENFYHQTTTSAEVEEYISKKAGIGLDGFFDQYLRTKDVPILEYGYRNDRLGYRWTNAVSNFRMPIEVTIDGERHVLEAVTQWKNLPLETKPKSIKVDPDYYVGSLDIIGL